VKVFYNREFRGHFPVGTSAVVVAYDAYDAAERLAAELRDIGLGQCVATSDMIELEMKPQVVVLQNGDY
jgi:hypothetical protein